MSSNRRDCNGETVTQSVECPRSHGNPKNKFRERSRSRAGKNRLQKSDGLTLREYIRFRPLRNQEAVRV